MKAYASWQTDKDSSKRQLWRLLTNAGLVGQVYQIQSRIQDRGRRYRAEVQWGGRSTWWLVKSPRTGRRLIQGWLAAKHWDSPHIQNPV